MLRPWLIIGSRQVIRQSFVNWLLKKMGLGLGVNWLCSSFSFEEFPNVCDYGFAVFFPQNQASPRIFAAISGVTTGTTVVRM
jgi:hypothetical protein